MSATTDESREKDPECLECAELEEELWTMKSTLSTLNSSYEELEIKYSCLNAEYEQSLQEAGKVKRIQENKIESLEETVKRMELEISSMIDGTKEEEKRRELEEEASFQKLLSQSGAIKKRIRRNLVKEDSEIQEMDEHLLVDAITFKGRSLVDKALKEIEEYQGNLEGFKIDAECGLRKANREHLDKIENEIIKLEDLKQLVILTNKKIKKEAENQNLMVSNQDESVRDLLRSAMPKFTGEGVPHILTWVRQLDIYIRRTGVSSKESGMVALTFIEGDAKKTIDATFKNIVSPNLDEVKKKLVAYYGDRNRILREIFRAHKKIGPVPANKEGFIRVGSSLKVSGHIRLLKEAIALTSEAEDNNNLERYMTVKPSDLDITTYERGLVKLIPPQSFVGYLEDKSTWKKGMTAEETFEKLRLLFERIMKISFQIDEMQEWKTTSEDASGSLTEEDDQVWHAGEKEEKEDEEDEDEFYEKFKDDKEGYDQVYEDWENEDHEKEDEEDEDEIYGEFEDDREGYDQVYEDWENEDHEKDGEETNSEQECEICEHMESFPFDKEYGQYTKNHHAFRISKSGHRYIRPDSCIQLSKRSIPEKIEFCRKFGICTKCLGLCHESHNSETCDFLERAKTRQYRCSDRYCNERMSLCAVHMDRNLPRLQKLEEAIREQGCFFRY